MIGSDGRPGGSLSAKKKNEFFFSFTKICKQKKKTPEIVRDIYHPLLTYNDITTIRSFVLDNIIDEYSSTYCFPSCTIRLMIFFKQFFLPFIRTLYYNMLRPNPVQLYFIVCSTSIIIITPRNNICACFFFFPLRAYNIKIITKKKNVEFFNCRTTRNTVTHPNVTEISAKTIISDFLNRQQQDYNQITLTPRRNTRSNIHSVSEKYPRKVFVRTNYCRVLFRDN